MKEKEIGFIILRHVNSDYTNKYWITCYNSIRRFYPDNKIIIIDDNSDYKYISNETLYNTIIIQSEYPKRGELLPYYYFLNNKLFDIAVIIHDSVFINKKIDFTVDKYKLIWDFEHSHNDQIEDETKMIRTLEDDNLLRFYQERKEWKGCFGVMTVITHDFLTSINNKYNISKLLPLIITRYNRMSLERVFSCILQKEAPRETLMGNILEYCPWGITYEQISNYSYLPIIKVWTGR